MSSHAASQSETMQEKAATQTQIIRRNISALTGMQKREQRQRSTFDRVADWITAFSGSIAFVIIHIIWFGLWILLNVGLFKLPHVSEFDKFPFSLLTMIVSLEAIFLSTFVLISQNRMAKLSEQRAELDLHVNLLAEQKATKALELLDEIAQQLNTMRRFNIAHDPELEALKRSPEPEEVLHVMREAVKDEVEEVTGEVKEKVDKAVGEITGELEEVREEVEDITGETEAVHGKVRHMDEKVNAVASDVQEIKEKVGAGEDEREEVSAK